MQRAPARRGSRPRSLDRGWRAARRAGTPAARATMARPRATRWRCPPESCAGLRSSSALESRAVGATSDAFVDRGRRDRRASAARRRGSRARSCAGRARSSGTPSRDRGPAAARRSRRGRRSRSARGRRLEAGDHPQHGALAAAGRSRPAPELAVGDRRDRGRAAATWPFGIDLAAPPSSGSTPWSALHRAGGEPRTMRRWNASTSSATGTVATIAAARI